MYFIYNYNSSLTGYWAGVENNEHLGIYESKPTFAKFSSSMKRMSTSETLNGEPASIYGVGLIDKIIL